MKRILIFLAVLVMISSSCRLINSSPSEHEIQETIEAGVFATQDTILIATNTHIPFTEESTQTPTHKSDEIESEIIREALSDYPGDGMVNFFGRVYFGDDPFNKVGGNKRLPLHLVTDKLPELSLDSNPSTVLSDDQVIFDPATSEYVIKNIQIEICEKGCDIKAIIWKEENTSEYMPEEFFEVFWNPIKTEDLSFPNTRFDVSTGRYLHLTSPYDSLDILHFNPRVGDVPVFEDSVLLSWDPDPNASEYLVEIYYESPGEGRSNSPIFTETTSRQQYTVKNLPPLSADTYYIACIYALDENGNYLAVMWVAFEDSGWNGLPFKIE